MGLILNGRWAEVITGQVIVKIKGRLKRARGRDVTVTVGVVSPSRLVAPRTVRPYPPSCRLLLSLLKTHWDECVIGGSLPTFIFAESVFEIVENLLPSVDDVLVIQGGHRLKKPKSPLRCLEI